MIAVDTSVIISLLRIEESNNAQAIDIFNENFDLIVPDFIFYEVLTVVKRLEGIDTTNLVYKYLTSNSDIKIYETPLEIYRETEKYFLTNSNKLSFPDALLLNYWIQKRIPIITFDKDLAKEIKKY